MSTAVVVSSDKDVQRSRYMGPELQQPDLLWERTRLDNVSENVSPASRPKGEQRETGEDREDLCGAGAEAS